MNWKHLLPSALFAFAGAAAFLLQNPAAGVVSLVVAAALFLIPAPRRLPNHTFDSLADALKLEGRAIHDGLLLFAPAANTSAFPALSGNEVHRSVAGLACTPPGLGLWEEWARHQEVKPLGVESAAHHIKSAWKALGLGNVKVLRGDAVTLILDVPPADALAFGTDQSSFAAMVLSVSTGKPVQYVSWDATKDGSELRLVVL